MNLSFKTLSVVVAILILGTASLNAEEVAAGASKYETPEVKKQANPLETIISKPLQANSATMTANADPLPINNICPQGNACVVPNGNLSAARCASESNKIIQDDEQGTASNTSDCNSIAAKCREWKAIMDEPAPNVSPANNVGASAGNAFARKNRIYRLTSASNNYNNFCK